ncbi:MAG: TlpA family protein disulfide reductase [Prevotella sp.]|jgi:peroxiredoxin|nr:TlpA family protein disulfide reductase [Prevotella sp.]
MKKLIILLATSLYTFTLLAQDGKIDIVKKGDQIPAFTLSSNINGNIDSKELEGKIVLINIFATWCDPCQVELAEIKKDLWPKYKDNPNFVMLTIGREHTDEELMEYNKKKEFTFPLYPDPKRDFTSKFATQNIPRSYLVDEKGEIIYMSVGFNEKDFKSMMKLIDEKLSEISVK